MLVVDDDMRNIFALSSALESYEFNVVIANDGEEAIAKLEEINDIDICIDGYYDAEDGWL